MKWVASLFLLLARVLHRLIVKFSDFFLWLIFSFLRTQRMHFYSSWTLMTHSTLSYKPSIYLLFHQRLFFKSGYRFTTKLRGKYRNFLYTYPLSSNRHSLAHYPCPSPKWYICYNWWAYSDNHYSPKSIIYIVVHSWCCAVYRFR